MKTCPCCRVEMSRTEFYRSKQTKDGLQGWCKVCQGKIQRKIRAEDPEKYRVQKRRAGQKTRRNLRLEVIAALGGTCTHCGISDHRVLEIDHVFDDGYVHRRPKMSYHTYLRGIATEVQAGSDRYQALCANCHSIKTWHRKEGVAWRPTS